MEHLPFREFQHNIWVLVCDRCFEFPKFRSGLPSATPSTTVQNIKESCVGESHLNHIKTAFESGADGVLICGCMIGDCKVNDNAARLQTLFVRQKFLADSHIELERVETHFIQKDCLHSYQEILKDFFARIKKLGPAKAPKGLALKNKAEA